MLSPGQVKPTGVVLQRVGSALRPAGDRTFRWLGRCFYFAAAIGLTMFGLYIVFRGAGRTSGNFGQWHDLISGIPLHSMSDWIASAGIGLHFCMGAVLVLAWPILFSSRIRARHRAVHRWTGRVYVAAGLFAGIGGWSFIVAHHTGRADHTAFAIWGSLMMLSAAMAFVHARAKRFDLHRAWAIRLFAMVLGSWVFDLEYRAWRDLGGGVGIRNPDGADFGLFDYVIMYGFFVPNLLVAEFFIRHLHRGLVMPRRLKWPVVALLASALMIFIYAIMTVSVAQSGKYGQHLRELIGV